MTIRQRLAELKEDVYDDEWWAFTFNRPLAALLIAAFGGLRWITPNRCTHAALATRLVACWLIAKGGASPWVVVVLLQASLTLDCCDGQLARFRGTSSALGNYYDKLADFWGYALLFLACGWAAFRETSDPLHLVAAGAGFAGLASTGYAKWVHVVLRSSPLPGPSRPPVSLGLWLRRSWSALSPEEANVMLWICVGLLVHRLPVVSLWIIGVYQTIAGLAMCILRGWQTFGLDRERAQPR